MGSLTSGPSIPSPQPQIIYVPQTPAPTPSTNADVPSGQSEEEQRENEIAIRSQSLLGRERSRFGTIQTGFRGLLGLADNSSQRKTLLGE